jgi:hypothetical protein
MIAVYVAKVVYKRKETPNIDPMPKVDGNFLVFMT